MRVPFVGTSGIVNAQHAAFIAELARILNDAGFVPNVAGIPLVMYHLIVNEEGTAYGATIEPIEGMVVCALRAGDRRDIMKHTRRAMRKMAKVLRGVGYVTQVRGGCLVDVQKRKW